MNGPCAKRRVICTIQTRQGRIVAGENSCANPQPTCPRLPGEGYEKCKTICRQAGHAEEMAVANARIRGLDIRGSWAALSGHYHMCQNCAAVLRDAGVTSVRIFFDV